MNEAAAQMATPVQVSCIKRRGGTLPPHKQIEIIGGIWNYKPWHLAERYAIAEAEKPADLRQWDFWVDIDGNMAPLLVATRDGRKYLTTPNGEDPLLSLPDTAGRFAT